MSDKTIKIKLKKSLIGTTKEQIKIVKALGLHKTNDVAEHTKSKTIMGMINRIPHMLEVVE